MLSDTINGAMVDDAPRRWRLNRAGIVNVYQYENEVLQFGGGRLQRTPSIGQVRYGPPRDRRPTSAGYSQRAR